MFDKLIPFLSKILAPIIVAACVWGANKTGIVALSNTEFTDAVVALIIWFLTEMVHTVGAKYINPSNAASTTLAVVDKERNAELKANETARQTPVI